MASLTVVYLDDSSNDLIINEIKSFKNNIWIINVNNKFCQNFLSKHNVTTIPVFIIKNTHKSGYKLIKIIDRFKLYDLLKSK